MVKYLVVICTIITSAMAAQLQFVEAVGGSYYDDAQEVVRTYDNGYAIAGCTNSYGAGGYDLILSRLNRLGQHLWTRVIGGSGDERDPISLVETADHGLIIVGITNSFGVGDYDILLVKFDVNGSLLWAKTIGGTNYDDIRHIVLTSDGGLAMTGLTYSFAYIRSDIFVVKTDSAANPVWAATMNWGIWDECGSAIVQTPDNGYVVAGGSWSFGSNDFCVVMSKFDNMGNWLWSRQMAAGEDPADINSANSIVVGLNGDIYISGCTDQYTAGGSRDGLLAKYDSSGNYIWTRAWGGSNFEEVYSMAMSPDHKIIVAGYTDSYGAGSRDFFCSKFDTDGNHLWSRSIGGTAFDFGFSMAVAGDSGFIIAGSTKSFSVDSVDMLLVKCDSLGMTCLGESLTPVVGSPSPGIGGYAPDVTHPAPTVLSQTPQILAVTPDTMIICYADIWPPVPFNLRSPADSAILAVSRPQFIWEASFDSVAGLERYEVYVNDSLKHIGADTTWTADYDLNDGANAWYVTAVDSEGNARHSNQDWLVFIDTHGPDIESTTIWLDTSYAGPFPVYAKATDICGVDTVILYFRRQEDPAWFMTGMMSGTGDWFYGEIPQVYLPGDTVKYYIYAKDMLANESTDPAGAPASYYRFLANWTGIQETKVVPALFAFGLKNNPSQNQAIFRLSLPQDVVVSLRIFDVSGRLIDEPISGLKRAGTYEIPWTAKAVSGIYFYILQSKQYERVGKIVIIK